MEERMTSKQATLDQRISAALSGHLVATDHLQALIPEAETGIEEADAVAARERDHSLDPHTAPQAAEQAAHRASVAELQRGRYQIALPRLRERLAKALAADREDRWHSDADRVELRAAAAEEGLARYGELADQILAALQEAEATNKEAARVNHEAPDGVHRRVYRVDLAQFEKLVLPDPNNPGRNLWPPHRPSVAEQYAATMMPVSDPRYSADWASARAARAEEARAAAQRHADYYANMTRQQEDRQNAEERERFAQSQRRG
jgi:hypothetical protein